MKFEQFIGSSGLGRSFATDAERTVNMYLERVDSPTGQTKASAILLRRPGLKAFCSLGLPDDPAPLGPLFKGKADFGNAHAFYIQGDWSAGLWLKLPPTAHGALISMGDAGAFYPPEFGAPYAYVLAVTGGPATFGIEYVHDAVGSPSHEYLPFDANISADTWIYVGASRNASAKTVTLYTSNGTTISTIGTQSYSAGTPGGTWDAAPHMTLGEFYYDNMGTTPSNGLFYPAISEIASAAMWAAALTSGQHLAAAQGTLPSTGLVFHVSNAGATPCVSSTVATGDVTATLTGTTPVDGPSGPNTARYF